MRKGANKIKCKYFRIFQNIFSLINSDIMEIFSAEKVEGEEIQLHKVDNNIILTRWSGEMHKSIFIF